MGIGASRRGVGNPRGRYDTRRHALLLRKLCQGRQRIGQCCGAVVTFDAAVHTKNPDAGFLTGSDCGDGAGAVWHLSIGVIGFNQR